jgi:hypothetical protein
LKRTNGNAWIISVRWSSSRAEGTLDGRNKVAGCPTFLF